MEKIRTKTLFRKPFQKPKWKPVLHHLVLAVVMERFLEVLEGVMGQLVDCPKNTRFRSKNKKSRFKDRRGLNF